MNSARRVQIPEGREAETHREDVILEKVAVEPNRFESEKIETFLIDRKWPKVALKKVFRKMGKNPP
jgi:hypothetical protein